MQPPLGARMVARVGKVVALVRASHPDSRFRAVIHHDLLGQAKAEVFLEKLAISRDVHSETVPMIQAAHVDAARREPLRLVFQRWTQLGWRLIPLCFAIELDLMPVRVLAEECRAVRQVTARPADVEARSF